MAQVWVRDYLRGLGISDKDIGWDPTTRQVMVRGAPLGVPVTVREGKAYADPTALRQAGWVGSGGGGATTAQSNQRPTFQFSDPYASQIQDLLRQLQEIVAQRPPTIGEIRARPEYQAFLGEAERRKQQAMSDVKAMFGAGNLDVFSPYTTAAIERLGELERAMQGDIANYEAALLRGEDERRARQVAGLLDLLNQLGSLSTQAFSQAYQPWASMLPYEYVTTQDVLSLYRGSDPLEQLATLLAALAPFLRG